ncbi:unnamed protein product [Clonostachys byssicola]|uniref:Cytochrome P450 n=1 Tax=Clonostachys byssicola TaxID=160290 RepID=A0A9N9XWD4_9HYPO|nr:unnamed protein product [Clonostachys byssicola]
MSLRAPILAITSLTLLLVFFIKIIYQSRAGPLRSIPGPWYTNYSHYVLKYETLMSRRMYYVHSLHRIYGPVVRLSPWQVAVADPEGFTAIHRIGSGFNKPKWFEAYMDKTGGLGVSFFAMSNPKEHGSRRKMFARPFSHLNLRVNCEDIIREKVDKAVDRIHTEALEGNSDILKWWMLMASDIIGQLSFGESFRLLEAGKKNHFIKVLETAAMSITLKNEFPLLYSFCRYIPLRSVQTFLNSSNELYFYGGRAVANLRQHNSEKTMFSNIVTQTEESKLENRNGIALSDDAIRIEASDFLLAGADTTSNTLTYVVWSILRCPDLHRRVLQELDLLGDNFDDAALEQLPLLNAIIQESLRLYGAVPGQLSRVVPPGGISIAGKFIPAGFEVETQAYTMHRISDVYCNPDRFDETRWLYPESLTPKQKSCFCSFGAGTRVCIGIHLAKMELRLGTAVLLKRCQTLKLADRTTEDSIKMWNFILAGPIARRCEVTVE